MKNPNISKPSGGVVTKLKDKLKLPKIAITAMILTAAGVLLSCGIYYMVDYTWNGSFVDWFSRNFMLTRMETDPTTGERMLVNSPNWSELKPLFLLIFIVTVVVVILVTAIISSIYGRRKQAVSITRTSRMIHSYMEHEVDAGDVFPAEYAEIAAQMAQIKALMQKHEQVLKEEAGRKNDMITYLAHDLKTPLTSVIGYLSLLQEAPDMPEKQKEKYVQITLDKALRLEKLTNEFFEITRFNLQQIVLEKETIDLTYLLIQLTDEFYPLLKSHGNEAKLESEEELTVYGDAVKLARVFNNILKNAISYSYPDTVIEITAKACEDEVIISFRNQGKTIPREKLNSIFEKFFRLDEARTTNTGGAGLGLAIAREIVTLHGGSLTADSENETTIFNVVLPKH